MVLIILLSIVLMLAFTNNDSGANVDTVYINVLEKYGMCPCVTIEVDNTQVSFSTVVGVVVEPELKGEENEE